VSAIEVTTQAQLDEALKKKLSPGDYIACVGGTPYNRLIVRGSAHVVARESAHVEAWESAHVEAWESAHVEARGSAHVEARGSAHVVARESAHVEAWESAHVVAWGSAHVVAWGSAHVEAWESAHVEAWESAHVEAWESAHVEAWESAHVEAWESAHVVASKFVAIHKRSSHRGRINGGVVIEVPDVSKMTPAEWADYYGAKVSRGNVLLYKAVDDDYSTPQARQREIAYTVGAKVKADDWKPTKACGNGLHACAAPVLSRSYNPDATRYVQVKAKLADVVVIDDKVKAPALTVVCECDIHGDPLA
jgi:hypothetical protein